MQIDKNKRNYTVLLCAVVLVTVAGIAARVLALHDQDTEYQVIDLGAVENCNIKVSSLNSRLSIVGFAETPAGETPNPRIAYHRAFVWSKGAFTMLTPSDPKSVTEAHGINAQDQVVGYSQLPDKPQTARAFCWEKGRLTPLETPPSAAGIANAINDSAQIVGKVTRPAIHAKDDSTVMPELDRFDHACLWEKGRLREIGALHPSAGTVANAINSRGQIVGNSSDGAAFLWQNGKMTDLGSLGGLRTDALGINQNGIVVGSSDLTGEGGVHAYVWEQGKMKDLTQSVGGSGASGINSHNDIVGEVEIKEDGEYVSHAALWRQGKSIDLNTQIPASSGWTLENAVAIDDDGRIIGTGILGRFPFAKELRHSFLLVPRKKRP